MGTVTKANWVMNFDARNKKVVPEDTGDELESTDGVKFHRGIQAELVWMLRSERGSTPAEEFVAACPCVEGPWARQDWCYVSQPGVDLSAACKPFLLHGVHKATLNRR